MGLIRGVLLLPLAPVRGVSWVAEQIRREAERQYYDPAAIHAALEELERAREAEEIPEAEADALEDELIGRLLADGGNGNG